MGLGGEESGSEEVWLEGSLSLPLGDARPSHSHLESSPWSRPSFTNASPAIKMQPTCAHLREAFTSTSISRWSEMLSICGLQSMSPPKDVVPT